MELTSHRGIFAEYVRFNRAKSNPLGIGPCVGVVHDPNLVCTDADVQVTFGFLIGQKENARHSVKELRP